MEVKGLSSVNFARQTNLNKANQNQVTFQGLKEKAFEAGVKAAPLGMIPEPMHFLGTAFVKYLAGAKKLGQFVAKKVRELILK